MQVALGAFGLDEDLNNKFLIARILESDTASRDSLTSRFADKRYQSLSSAFGFGNESGPRISEPGFADRIVEAYRTRKFEIAVGDQAPDLRLAMGIERDLGNLATQPNLSADGAWFGVMANKPLRRVFETALGLPQSFGTLDLDRQLSTFRQRSDTVRDNGNRRLRRPGHPVRAWRLFWSGPRSIWLSSFAPASVASPPIAGPKPPTARPIGIGSPRQALASPT